jgi:aspartokinase
MNRNELLEELQEQARLVGMGAERELALMAKVQRLERVNAELLDALETIVATERERHGYHPAWTDQARAAIAKARGEK